MKQITLLLFLLCLCSVASAEPNAVTLEQQAELDAYENMVSDYEQGKFSVRMKGVEEYDVMARKIFTKSGLNTIGNYLVGFFSSFFALGFLHFMFRTINKMDTVTLPKIFELCKTWIFLALAVLALPFLVGYILGSITTVVMEVDKLLGESRSLIKIDMTTKIAKACTFMFADGWGSKIPTIMGVDVGKMIKPNQYEGVLTIVLAGLLVSDYLLSASLYLEQIFALKCLSVFMPLICLAIAWARDENTMYDRLEKAVRIVVIVALMIPLVSAILAACNKVYSLFSEVFNLGSTLVNVLESLTGFDVIWKIPIAVMVLFLKVRLIKATQDLAWKALY